MKHLLLVALSLLLGCAPLAAKQPNVLIILADDMGWADLGCYGSDLHETPNIDRLAKQSVRFTDAYAMPVCSPTRAALLTGRHAARLHITIWAEGALEGPKNRMLFQADSQHDLAHSETTLAQYLHNAGYLTALVGKWHLGDADHFPESFGFDVNIGGTHWGAPQTYWWPYSGAGRYGKEFRFVPHLEFGKPGEYLTDRLTDEALKVIDHAGNRPFFLYLAHHAPHTPIEAKEEDIKHFEAKLRPGMNHQNAVYAAMIKSFDESVGRVLTHLKDRGLEKDTIVVFASDNGGYIGTDKQSGQKVPVTNNAPLRSGKGACYEGGIRVPLMIHVPGLSADGSECREPVAVMDLVPTLLKNTGTALPEGVKLDGLDLSPLLKDPAATLQRDALYWHYPHYYETTTPVGAVRMRDWKLLEYFQDNHVELYNLRDDLGEKKDLAKEMPEKAEELRKRLHEWRAEVNAAMPTRNSDFKGKK